MEEQIESLRLMPGAEEVSEAVLVVIDSDAREKVSEFEQVHREAGYPVSDELKAALYDAHAAAILRKAVVLARDRRAIKMKIRRTEIV